MKKIKNIINQYISNLIIQILLKTIKKKLIDYNILLYKYNNPPNNEFDKFEKKLMFDNKWLY